MPRSGDDAARELARLLADAVARVEQVSGTLSVGSVVRPDVPAEVARFIEGRWAALREVDRRAGLDGIPVALATVRHEWSAGTAPGMPDPVASAAYRQGGLAALDELAKNLSP